MQNLFAWLIVLHLSVVGCRYKTNSVSNPTTFENLEAVQTRVFSASDVDFALSYKSFSLVKELDQVVTKVSQSFKKNTLWCSLTEEVAGLFVCVGNSKEAQHIPLNRAAIFVEGRPSLGVPNSGVIVSQAASIAGYSQSSGHDLTELSLRTFFERLSDSCPDLSCVLPGEQLFAQSVMAEMDSIYPNGYSVVSVDTSSSDSLKRSLAHESAHGQFFQQPQYRAAVYGFWNSLPSGTRIAASKVIGKNYDVVNVDLLINEFHAYILDRKFSDIPISALEQMRQSDPEQALALSQLSLQSESMRIALLTSLRSAVPLVLHEAITGN